MGRLIFLSSYAYFLESEISPTPEIVSTVFVFCKIFNIMILYWNIFYLYIFTVKLLFIYLRRIK